VPPIIPDSVPSHFPAGTTVRFTRSLDDYSSADGWTYTIYLNGLTQKFNKAASVQNDGQFLIELLPTDTEPLSPGPYRYCERLSNPGTRFVLTGVSTDGTHATYAYSSFTGPAPYIGMPVTTSGFSNSGNNVSVASAITAMVEGPSGTFTIASTTAVNESSAAAGAGPQQVFDIRGDELVINIEPDAASSPAGTFQTFEEKTLAVLEAAIAGNLSGGIQSYQISGRAVSKYQMAELMKLRGMFRAAVWRQQNPGKLGKPYEATFTTEQETPYPPTWVDVTGIDR
jgi:hypothetical protein